MHLASPEQRTCVRSVCSSVPLRTLLRAFPAPAAPEETSGATGSLSPDVSLPDLASVLWGGRRE
eukprot:2318431-Pyramimonas_sp.AAC.1